MNDYSDFSWKNLAQTKNDKKIFFLRPVRLPAAASARRNLHADAEHEPGLVQPLPQRDQQDTRQARHQVDPPHR